MYQTTREGHAYGKNMIVHTEKCRFMGTEVRENSVRFVAPLRGFPLSVWHNFHARILKYYKKNYISQ